MAWAALFLDAGEGGPKQEIRIGIYRSPGGSALNGLGKDIVGHGTSTETWHQEIDSLDGYLYVGGIVFRPDSRPFRCSRVRAGGSSGYSHSTRSMIGGCSLGEIPEISRRCIWSKDSSSESFAIPLN